ncbi:hypothetical protein HAX54_019581 [Datura stramonium]|uniref:Uncharacterized protein n=1 Tax=Datura stramonium TaxID=4076 RepID=A0ABS8USA1_DATST|nr:hypothetical protein [Datura stramonium]
MSYGIQRFPQSLKYERLQRVFRNKMSITDPEDVVIIIDRYPMYFIVNGLPIYGETLISDDESLTLFLHSPDIFRNHISITTLDMYAIVERSLVIPKINDNEFDFRNTTYLSGLNTGLSRSVMQQETMIGFGRPQNDISNTGIESNIVGQMPCNNYDWSMCNYEMGGPSSVAAHMGSFDLSTDQPAQPSEFNFGRDNIIQQVFCPSQSTDRCNDVVKSLPQLTEIVNNDNLVVVQQDALDSDTHSNHGLTEDDHSSDDEDVVNVKGEGHDDQNVNYSSIVISYLDSIEENTEDFVCMRDSGPV